ncbi:MAG: ATP-binding protein [Clostridia bacterium]|nr:ATP-binding protein [Clostridia bacterium]
MRNSIFSRYITSFLIIIFVSFTVLTVIISSMTVQFADNQKKNVAINTSQLLYDYLSSERLYPSVQSFYKELTSMIDLLSQNAETLTIIITDTSDTIIVSTEDEYSGEITDPAVLQYVRGTDVMLVYTDLDGMLQSTCGVVVTPLVYNVDGWNSFAGTLYVCYEAKSVDVLTTDAVRTIILASMWVMVASLIIVYFTTERIVAPLRRMNEATKRFAAGKFDTRLPVRGNDEVAQLSTSFNAMAEALADIEYQRSSFLANISHDLRTPMTSISGFIDGILDGAIPPEKQEYYLRIVSQEVRRLSRLVSQLLDISRLEAGNRKFEKVPFDICEMARIILISFENKIDEKRLDVEFTASADRITVFSDKDAVNQVLYNICDNAVKFSNDGGKYKIEITEAKDRAYVSVYNEGKGISHEDLPHVFDRFYKSDKSRGLDKTGVGLGLYICKTIMDNLDGTISVESIFGSYCKFTISLPKAQPSKRTVEKSNAAEYNDVDIKPANNDQR